MKFRGRRARQIWHQVYQSTTAIALVLTRALQIRSVAAEAGQEDGNHPARALRLHLLWKDNSKETLGGDLEMPGMQEDGGWRGMDGFVRRLPSISV